jgi:hypothetical protein
MSAESTFVDGGCTCRFVRYRMLTRPLFVHCCHCRWCQRETGASFALNALIEADRVELLQGEVEIINTPSTVARARRFPAVRGAASRFNAIRFIRVGTLDEPDRLPPDIHIYTVSKQPWVLLPPDMPAVLEFYSPSERWPKESLERRAALLADSQKQ